MGNATVYSGLAVKIVFKFCRKYGFFQVAYRSAGVIFVIELKIKF
jgi:hypothetical protein